MASIEEVGKLSGSELKKIAKSNGIELLDTDKKKDVVAKVSAGITPEILADFVGKAPVVDKSFEVNPTPVEPKNTEASKATNTTEKVDKSFLDDKKTVNKKIKVGDRVSYPYREGEHGKRTSKVYAVDGDNLTILGYDGQKTTIAASRVELA